jgi:beta-lactam-binding protein with PASTA domain/tRNA A-37 threonylcarbamoyl transferase component Bud32
MIGRLVDGRYQVRSRIARGGMATVYLATDLRLERRVAIKIMHGHLADDAKFRERFIQEARSAARLAHPNVVNVFDQGQDTDMAYLVMEYLPGITLRDLLQERHVLTTEQTFDILEAVLAGLAAAHKAGIVHRDLKPENVLLADDGRIKIGDFGLARAASANTATGAALLGTIAYLSPELVTRGIADTRSDIYAAGIMMYEMLAGEQPFKGEQPMQIAYQHANDSVPVPSTKNPRVPAELDEIVLWATAREPEERPRDARVMLDQLVETREHLRTALPTTPTAVQRTAALEPAALAAATFTGSNAETQVISTGRRAATGALDVRDASATLRTRAEKRRVKGWWLSAAIVLAAGLAGGTGWYFGTGPGSLVTIPTSIVGQSPADATTALVELDLVVRQDTVEVFDPFVTPGLVASTDPPVGQAVAHETAVTLQVSKGPEPVAAPELIGADEATAIQRIEDAGLLLDAEGRAEQFSDAAPGVVLAAFGVSEAGERIALPTGTPYFDQRPVSLVVSVGPLPSVSGMSYDEAKAALAAVEVGVLEGSREFDDTVPADRVLRAAPQVADTPISPGDTVLLVFSKGVDLVAIPDIIGESIRDAKAMLEDAGFAVVVDTDVNGAFWGIAQVQSFEPGEEDGSLKRGTQITIYSHYDD